MKFFFCLVSFVSISYLSFGQKWFEDIFQNIPTIEIPVHSQMLKSMKSTPISVSQYNTSIGNKIGFIEKDGELVKEIVYGEINDDDMPEGLLAPAASIVGKILLSGNIKTIVLRLDQDPKLDLSPILQLCNFDEQNKYLSTLWILGGDTESGNGKIVNNQIIQTIYSEGQKEVCTFTINKEGYFKLESSIITSH